MSACVLPIAPEFQDPPASENIAPEFIDTDPPAGSIVSEGTTFNLVIRDPNINDDLEVRWISDFPPLTAASSIMRTDKVPHSPTGQLPIIPPFQPDCLLDHIATGTTHQIVVVVADRPFLPPQLPDMPGSPTDFERLPADAKTNSRSWTLNLVCPTPQK